MTGRARSSYAAATIEASQIEKDLVHLSAVVPCFNEKNAVERTLRQLERVLAAIESHEIIAVD